MTANIQIKLAYLSNSISSASKLLNRATYHMGVLKVASCIAPEVFGKEPTSPLNFVLTGGFICWAASGLSAYTFEQIANKLMDNIAEGTISEEQAIEFGLVDRIEFSESGNTMETLHT